jgi:hypothetical protein
MDKDSILREIKRTAEANGGIPVGQKRFFAETGIKQSDWLGKYWARWSDAQREAGYSPNEPCARVDELPVILKLIALTRELGRFPTRAEIRLNKKADDSFRGSRFMARLGTKHNLMIEVFEFCRKTQGYEDVMHLLTDSVEAQDAKEKEIKSVESEDGYVYLIRSGRFYKVGRTNAIGRRERELAIQLPEKAVTVHSIKTDDPIGIEAYWHKRFEAKRRNGEWF